MIEKPNEQTVGRAVSRRTILQGAAGAMAQSIIGSSIVAATASASAQSASAASQGPVASAAKRKAWVQLAESLKPQLLATKQDPVALVHAVADASRYLRWRMEVDVPGAALRDRLLRKGDSFILDFGGHRTGYLEFDLVGEGTSVDSPTRLRITFGEVPGDVAEPLYPYHGSLSSAWLPEEIVTIDFLPQHVQLPLRYAFRFVKIEVLDTSPNYAARFLNTHAIAVTSANHEPPAIAGDLPAWMHKVDEVSLATLRDCMQTTFEDGPRRDQRLWIGDLRLQARANYVTFKNHDLVKRCLYLFAGLPRESDGFLPACVFEKPTPVTTGTFILDYAALFGAIILDYLRATGDLKTARDLWPVALQQLEILLTNVDSSGIFQIPPNSWAFIDWNTKLDKGASMQGVIVYACRQLRELAHMIGTESEVARYPNLIEKMATAGHKRYYDPQRAICVSGDDGQVSWASQAWLTLSGCLSKQESAVALRKAVLEDPTSIRPSTPYLYHHVTEAMIECGMKREALSLIQNYWGAMVDAGADTFWEAYDPDDSRFSPYGDVHINSFCHAWSCTPAYFFRETDWRTLDG